MRTLLTILIGLETGEKVANTCHIDVTMGIDTIVVSSTSSAWRENG